MAYRSTGTGVAGTGTSAAVPVPASVAIGDIVTIGLYLETTDATITWPAGFTQKADTGATNATTRGRLLVAWKRLTATDSGTYSVTWTTSVVYEAVAVAHSGRIRIGDPFEGADTGVSTNSTGTAANNTSYTTAESADDNILFTTSHATNSAYTAASGFTERYDNSGSGTCHITANTRDASSTGAQTTSASFTGTTGNSFPRTFNGSLRADRVGLRASDNTGAPANTSAFTANLPTHAAGDRLVVVVMGKDETTAIPTIDQGFTLLGSSTGGTGSAGSDTGQVFVAVYAKDATSSSETSPTVTPGSPAPNTWTWSSYSYTPANGKTWADAITTSAAWVQFAADTNTATPLTASATFPNQPTVGDAIMVVGAIPTDAATTVDASSTVTATGITGGGLDRLYIDTSLNNDCGHGTTTLVGFAGTASSAVTASQTFAGSANFSGVMAFVALRQAAPTDVTVSPPAATATATAQVPTVSGTTSATVSPPAATATAAALTPTVDATQSATVSPPAATATAAALVPSVSAAGSATVSPPAATATAAAPTPTVTATQSATVSPPAATATAQAHAPTVSTSVDVTVSPPAATATAQAWAPTAEGTEGGVTATDTSNTAYALMFTGDADVTWEPAVVARPTLLPHDVEQGQISARKIDDYDVTTEGSFDPNTYDETVVSIPRHRDRIVVGNTDVTFKDGLLTKLPDYELLEPFTYGSGGQLVLPSFNARHHRLGVGKFKRVKLGAPVKYQRVDEETGEVVATDYKGFVLREGRSGDQLSLEIAGELLGRAALEWHPVPIFRKLRDAAIQMGNVVVGLGLRYSGRFSDPIGIDLATRGGQYQDEFLTDTVAQLTTGDGDQWTVMTDEHGRYTHSLKDRETIHATVYLDNEFATADLGNDLAEKYNRVWINAVAPDGQRIMHASAPNMQYAPTPEFPTVGGNPMTIDDVDADTSTGDGVTVLVWRLTFTGLLDREDHNGGFDDDVAEAIRDFQKDAGCTNLTGSVDEETWNKLWDNYETSYSVQFAAQRPAVQDDKVQKFDRDGSGNIIGRHEGYVEGTIKVDLAADMGMVGSRRRAFKMARAKLTPVGQDDYVGTITLTSGLIEGEHNPGDPLTADMVIPNRAVRPGWNIWVPYFGADPGTLFHVSAVRVRDNGWTVELVVDTRARDAMEAWAVHKRNLENRYKISRYLGGGRRRTLAVQDTVTPWDKIVGQTDRDWPLTGGEWNLIPVPSGQVGTVQNTTINLDKPAEFAVLVTERKVPLGRLNRKVAPLTPPPPDPQRHRVTISGSPTGGTFTLQNDASDETSTLAYNASVAAVQAAVRGLGGAFADVTVSGHAGGPYTISMSSEADLDVGSNDLTGGHSPSMSVTTSGPSSGPGTPWYEKEAIRDWLRRYRDRVGWGTVEQPCGYDPRQKTNNSGEATDAPVTGEFFDEESFGYDCGIDGAVLYVYIWVEADNVLPRQRIFTQQLDGSGT